MLCFSLLNMLLLISEKDLSDIFRLVHDEEISLHSSQSWLISQIPKRSIMCDSPGQKLWAFVDVQYLRGELQKPLPYICQLVTSLSSPVQ